MKEKFLNRRFKRQTLDNGLVVLMEEVPKEETVAIQVGIKIGSAYESRKFSGTSHFIEHLLFRDNEYRTAKEIIRTIEWGGAVVTADTGFTCTNLKAEFLPSESKKIIEVIYQMVSNYRHDPTDFQMEKQVILGEIQRAKEDPTMFFLGGLFFPILLRGSPFEKLVEGNAQAIEEITKDELEEFKRVYYVPNDMVVVVVGKFREDIILEAIDNTFGRMKSSSLVLPELKIDLTNKKKIVYKKRNGIEAAYTCLGYKLPDYSQLANDYYPLRVLDSILGGGLSGRVFQKLRDEKGIGYSVGAIFYNSVVVAPLFVYATDFPPHRIKETRKAILEIFEELKTQPVSDSELEGFKNILLLRYKKAVKSVQARARIILEDEIENIPFDFWKFREEIKKVTKESVMEVANKYLTDQYTFTALVPKGFKL